MAFDWNPTHREVLSVHKCDQCDGDGVVFDEDDDVVVCAECTGFGNLTDCGQPYRYNELVHQCYQCDGDGIAIDEDSYVGVCAKCTGSGLLTDCGKPYKDIEVTVSTEVTVSDKPLEVTVSDKPYTDDGV